MVCSDEPPGTQFAVLLPGAPPEHVSAVAKKLRFVDHAVKVLGLANVTTRHARVERMQGEAPFDTVVSRAFAPLPRLLEWMQPLCDGHTRVVAMKDRRVTVLDEASRTHFTLPYAAIVTTPHSGSDNGDETSVPVKPTPPPEIASREDFRVGNRVSFTDQSLQHRVGLIVRINQRTATLDCDGQTWRVGFGLLRPLVDI